VRDRAELADFSLLDYVMTVAMALLVSLALLPVAQFAGRRLAPERVLPPRLSDSVSFRNVVSCTEKLNILGS